MKTSAHLPSVFLPVVNPCARTASLFAMALSLFFVIPVQGAQVLFYDFEEGIGGTTADLEAGNTGNNTGTLNNGANWSSTTPSAASDFSLSLDGTDDYVSIANPGSLLQAAPGFTLAAFVRLDTFATTGYESVIFVGNGSSTSQARAALQIGENGKFGVGGRRADGDSFARYGSTTGLLATDGTWAHIAATVAFSNSGPTVSLYLNGDLVSNTRETSGAFSNGLSTSNTASLVANIGANGPASGEFVDGLIDDARVYNTVLSQSEIAGLIPEPSSALLLFLGLAAFGLIARRSR